MTQAAPFRFATAAGRVVEGPAFARTFRAGMALFVLSTGFWLALVWLATGGAGLLAGFFALFAMLVFFCSWILRSRTAIDSQALHQTWFADKHMRIEELESAEVLRLRGLEWLVTPRLHARTLMGKFAIFHAADPAVLAEFERLARELQAFRQR